MTFVSKVMSTGAAAEHAKEIVGTGTVALVAVGTNQATALQLSDSYNTITTATLHGFFPARIRISVITVSVANDASIISDPQI